MPIKNTVPFCEECDSACCRYGLGIDLQPEEFRKFYLKLKNKNLFLEGGAILFSNGKCPFLEDKGCSCNDDKPHQCLHFDCRVIKKDADFFQQFPKVLKLIKKHKGRN